MNQGTFSDYHHNDDNGRYIVLGLPYLYGNKGGIFALEDALDGDVHSSLCSRLSKN